VELHKDSASSLNSEILQCTVPAGRTCDLCNQSYFHTFHNNEYCMVLVASGNSIDTIHGVYSVSRATVTHNHCVLWFWAVATPQWCFSSLECGRCPATRNLESKYFSKLFKPTPVNLPAMHEEWRIAHQVCVPALRAQWGQPVLCGLELRRGVETVVPSRGSVMAREKRLRTSSGRKGYVVICNSQTLC